MGKMNQSRYVPDIDIVFRDLEDDRKEHSLAHHSNLNLQV